MLKNLEWLAIVASVVLVFSLVGVAYLSSPPAGHPREQQTSTQAEHKNQTEEQHSVRGFIRYLFPDGIAVFTFFLVLATIILGVVAIVQIGFLERAETIAADSSKATKEAADATRDAVKLAEQTAERQLRAYITPVSGNIIGFGQPGQVFRVNVTFKNSGQSPAYDLEVRPDVIFAPYPVTGNLITTGALITAGVLGPGSEYGANSRGAAMTAEQIQAVRDGSRAIYIHGTYQYRDAFRKQRSGTYRFLFHGPENDATGNETTLSFDREGNTAD